MEDGKLCIKTLAVIDCAGKHSAAATMGLLKTVLERFEISKEQILAIVTDNASAMIKAVKLFNEDRDNDEDSDCGEGDGGDNEDELDNAVDLAFVGHEFSTASTVRCAAHTLQLAIRDGLKSHKGANSVIAQARTVAKKLRTPSMMSLLKKKGGLLPVVDVPTRWGSTFNMLDRLLHLKDTISEYAAAAPYLHLSDTQWQYVEDIRDILKEPYNVTIRLQTANLTPGNFLKEWVRLKQSLTGESAIGNSIASCIQEREAKLFDDALLAALFADARYRLLIPEAYRHRSETAFARLWKRIRMIKNTISPEASPGNNPTCDEEEDDFENQLDRLAKESDQECRIASSGLLDPVRQIKQLGRLKGTDIWGVISSYPNEIRNECFDISALPVTQVSVERLFSAMRILLSDLRSRLKSDIVDAILFLKNNH